MTHQDEQRKINTGEQWDQAVFRPHNMPTPRYLDGENVDQYRKLPLVRTQVIIGSAFDLVRSAITWRLPIGGRRRLILNLKSFRLFQLRRAVNLWRELEQ